VWSLEEWTPSPVSLRGRWAIEKPDAALASIDPASSPLANVPVLPAARRANLGLPLDGPITDLAYDAPTDRFLVTTEKGIYITDGTFGRVVRHTVVDTGFSVDLARFAAGAFLGSDTVMAVSENKSYVILRENDKADAAANYRYFLASFDKFDEVSRSRFTTVRAKMMYVMSATFDPASGSVYTVTVPNTRVKRLVISRFDRRDMTLSRSSRRRWRRDPGSRSRRRRARSTRSTRRGPRFAGGKLYVISAAFGTLLTIDPQARAVIGAFNIRAWNGRSDWLSRARSCSSSTPTARSPSCRWRRRQEIAIHACATFGRGSCPSRFHLCSRDLRLSSLRADGTRLGHPRPSAGRSDSPSRL